VVGFQYGLLVAAGVTRFSWRYIGLREAVRILFALAAASSLLALVRLAMVNMFPAGGYAQYAYLPLGVIGIDFALSCLGIVGARAARRLSVERREVQRLRSVAVETTPVLLVGAGRAGLMVAKEIAGRPELGLVVVGFIDDDAVKYGSMLHGKRVLGGIADIQNIAKRYSVEQAIITIADAPGSQIREIANACRRAELAVKVIPGLYQIVSGSLNLTRLRDVAIEDLLRREPIVLDEQAIGSDLSGRTALVTGAGGSIGSELCRQIARFSPQALVLVERSENALFEIHRELHDAHPGISITPFLADVGDRPRMKEIFGATRPEVVFHAAAHKHVPMMEWNPREAIKNNVLGSKVLAEVALEHEIRAFVMISTDKAVNPTSVMGASKRAAEIYVQSLARANQTRFVTVRFGNVLGSNGSVVPIFREQIARGGPITITHPDMKRYFMTIPEACQLVLEAAALGRGGEIFILDMGEPVKIVDLARDLIQLSGLEEDDIEIVYRGIRPGEKLYEELLIAEEIADKTVHPKVFVGRTVAEPLSSVQLKLDRLIASLLEPGVEEMFAALTAIVPEYRPPGTPSDPPSRDAAPVVPSPMWVRRPLPESS
jgi:FlaA1/EpsC-like NDP-sugar epimerase